MVNPVQNEPNQPRSSSNETSPYVNSTDTNRNQIDLVDEMVEQALVDNLLDGTYYNSTNQIDLRNATNTNQSSNDLENNETESK